MSTAADDEARQETAQPGPVIDVFDEETEVMAEKSMLRRVRRSVPVLSCRRHSLLWSALTKACSSHSDWCWSA